MTLIELLVASAMSIVVLGAASTMVISTMHAQPKLSQRSEDVSTARWVLERMTREIRNGVVVTEASASTVSFRAFVRRTECGSGATLASDQTAIECQITYSCTVTACSRGEAPPGQTGSPVPIFSGIESDEVFNYAPTIEDPTFVGVTLRFPNPDGDGRLTISDGASMRSASLFGS